MCETRGDSKQRKESGSIFTYQIYDTRDFGGVCSFLSHKHELQFTVPTFLLYWKCPECEGAIRGI